MQKDILLFVTKRARSHNIKDRLSKNVCSRLLRSRQKNFVAILKVQIASKSINQLFSLIFSFSHDQLEKNKLISEEFTFHHYIIIIFLKRKLDSCGRYLRYLALSVIWSIVLSMPIRSKYCKRLTLNESASSRMVKSKLSIDKSNHTHHKIIYILRIEFILNRSLIASFNDIT